MDKLQVQQFRERWRLAKEGRQKEVLTTGLELRWQQLNSAFGMGKAAKLGSGHSGEMRVYQRWAKLKENILRPPKA